MFQKKKVNSKLDHWKQKRAYLRDFRNEYAVHHRNCHSPTNLRLLLNHDHLVDVRRLHKACTKNIERKSSLKTGRTNAFVTQEQ